MRDVRSKVSELSNSTTNNLTFEDRLIGEKEVAAYLSLGLSTIQQWRLKGKGPRFIRLGRLVRYRESDLRVYIEGLASYQSTTEADMGGAS